jgi:hypothetical protein
MARLRIQTAANGVNVFVESMRLLASHLDIRIKLGHHPIDRFSGDAPSLLSRN